MQIEIELNDNKTHTTGICMTKHKKSDVTLFCSDLSKKKKKQKE